MKMKDKKILYVEDDLSRIEGLKYTLEKNGLRSLLLLLRLSSSEISSTRPPSANSARS